MASSAPPPFLANIQYLRAVAALGVLFYHAGIATGVPFNRGATGVHLFFVISGFIMVAITGEDTKPWPFFRARLLRIAPPYWVATIAALAVYALTVGGRPAAAEILASFLFLPWGPPGQDAHYFPVLEVGWTLNYEMFFYAAFASALFLPRRFQLIALTAAFAVIYALRTLGLPFAFWGQTIVFEFIVGAWLAAYWKTGRTMVPVAAGLLVLWIALHRFSAPQELLPIPIVTALVAAALAMERGSRWRFPLFLGEASYSIYLWHLFGVRLVPLDGVAGFVLASLSGLATGIAGYFLVERPLRRRFGKARDALPRESEAAY
jgi:exopolysaccharide production protein ExoZ